MSEGDFDLKICCMGAGYVGGPTMAVIAKMCPKVSRNMTKDTKLDCIAVTGNKKEHR